MSSKKAAKAAFLFSGRRISCRRSSLSAGSCTLAGSQAISVWPARDIAPFRCVAQPATSGAAQAYGAPA
ncbi:hypothetical protein AKI39_02975 [Bordetella sp. H567]|nr:hypothetical protein AKI39_02975 [Bordetella sp. H567]